MIFASLAVLPTDQLPPQSILTLQRAPIGKILRRKAPDGDKPPTCFIRRFRKNSCVAEAPLVACGQVTVVIPWINMHVGSVFMQRGTRIKRLGIKGMPARDLFPSVSHLLPDPCGIHKLRYLRVEPTAYTTESVWPRQTSPADLLGTAFTMLSSS